MTQRKAFYYTLGVFTLITLLSYFASI